MKDLASYLLTQIVDNPEEVEVTEENISGGTVNLTLKVAAGDMGKVIGKGGKMIQAIRDLIKILALKRNLYVNVTLAE